MHVTWSLIPLKGKRQERGSPRREEWCRRRRPKCHQRWGSHLRVQTKPNLDCSRIDSADRLTDRTCSHTHLWITGIYMSWRFAHILRVSRSFFDNQPPGETRPRTHRACRRDRLTSRERQGGAVGAPAGAATATVPSVDVERGGVGRRAEAANTPGRESQAHKKRGKRVLWGNCESVRREGCMSMRRSIIPPPVLQKTVRTQHGVGVLGLGAHGAWNESTMEKPAEPAE